MILLVDNYDSFSYNLYQLLGTLEPDIRVVRNDALTVDAVRALNPAAIVLSPGPGKPAAAGICVETVRRLGGAFPILGVCLGHQAICEAYGGTVSYAKRQMHGKTSRVSLDTQSRLFQGLPAAVPVARYHSLALKRETLPACLRVTAETEDGEIMAVAHRAYPVFGLQFHPESILTPDGPVMIRHFIRLAERT